jgi:hypothetical protein
VQGEHVGRRGPHRDLGQAFRRAFRAPVFMVSVGNALPMDRTNVVLDSLATGELRLYLSLMGRLGFKTAVVGQSELYHGPSTLERMAREAPIAFVSASLGADAIPGIAAFHLQQADDCTLGVTGLVAREDHPLYDRVWETRTAGIAFEPPVPSVVRAVDALRANGADIVVVGGKIKPAVVRDLARAAGPAVFVSYQPVCKCVSADGRLFVNDESGFVGESLVFYPKAGRYGVTVCVLFRDASGRIVDFREEQVYMTEEIADDPETRRAIDDFYLSKPAAASPASLSAYGFWADAVDQGARFVGAPVCQPCHAEEYDQWVGTDHGSAFKTLLTLHRQYNPTCVSCHVTGFEQATGYAFGDMHSPMANVQCEACHGPGSAHVAAGGDAAIAREPADRLCKTCHSSDHSDMTDENFPDYYEKVVH